MRTKATLCGAVLTAIAVLSGCGGHVKRVAQPSGPDTIQSTDAGAASAVSGSGSNTCTIYESGNDARVIVAAAEPASECATLARGLSSGGSFWTQQYQPPSEPPLSMVCIMSYRATYEAEVDDDGGRFNGQQVCSAFTVSGWTENTAAEQQRSAAAQASAASSSAAAASAAAAQAEQDQLAEDQHNATGALANLKQDSDFTSDLSGLAADVRNADEDLASARADAAQGQGDYCINVSSTVYNDAASTLYNDAQSSVYTDLQTIASAVGTARTDIEHVQSALQRLSVDGLAAPAGNSDALRSARAAITAAISTANAAADHANNDVSAAYAMANSLATGACAGMGPGKPPTPLQHIT